MVLVMLANPIREFIYTLRLLYYKMDGLVSGLHLHIQQIYTACKCRRLYVTVYLSAFGCQLFFIHYLSHHVSNCNDNRFIQLGAEGSFYGKCSFIGVWH